MVGASSLRLSGNRGSAGVIHFGGSGLATQFVSSVGPLVRPPILLPPFSEGGFDWVSDRKGQGQGFHVPIQFVFRDFSSFLD